MSMAAAAGMAAAAAVTTINIQRLCETRPYSSPGGGVCADNL